MEGRKRMEPILVVCLCDIIGLVCVGVVGYVLFRPVATKEPLDTMAASVEVPEEGEDQPEDGEDQPEDGEDTEDAEDPVDPDTVAEESPAEDEQA